MVLRVLVLIIIFALFQSVPTQAAKKRSWSTPPAALTVAPSVSARLTGRKQYLNLNFRGISATNGFTYELTFNGNNLEQGIYGTIKPSERKTSRSLFLGTCSHGACTPYKNINNLHLTVTYQLKTGQSVVKKYQVRY